MSDRFQKLFSLENNLYIENAPIIISAAALLKDTKSGNMVVQIKFKSVSNKNIKGVKISLSAHDVSGKEINGVDDYQYLDLNIPNGQSFGSNKAIVVPETTTRSFDIKSITVIFADSSVWENASPNFVAIPNAKPLNSELENEELIKQYKIATTNKANYVPNTFLNLWTCSCGEVNSEEYCTSCGTNKNNTFSKYDITDLTEAMNLRLDKEKEEQLELERENERIRKNKEEKKRKIKKASIISAISLLVIGVIIVLINLPFAQYGIANIMHKTKNYDKAYDIYYHRIYDYKDSSEKTKAVKYDEANFLFKQGKYVEAAENYQYLEDYKDSNDKEKESKYLAAEQFVKNEKYEEAYKLYDELKDYKESETKAKEYKTGIFEETKRINVGCDYGGFDIFNSARAESIDVEAKIKVSYYKGTPDYSNVEMEFDGYEWGGNGWTKAYYKYIGELSDNSITGKGEIHFRYGSLIYSGNFKNGKYDGYGEFYILYDSYFVGNEIKNRETTLISSDWKNGNIEGEYKRINKDGSIYDTGTVKNGVQYSKVDGECDWKESYTKPQ